MFGADLARGCRVVRIRECDYGAWFTLWIIVPAATDSTDYYGT